MCLAKVYLSGMKDVGPGEPVLDEVTHINVQDGRLLLQDLLGNKKVLTGTIAAIDFLDSVVTVTGTVE